MRDNGYATWVRASTKMSRVVIKERRNSDQRYDDIVTYRTVRGYRAAYIWQNMWGEYLAAINAWSGNWLTARSLDRACLLIERSLKFNGFDIL